MSLGDDAIDDFLRYVQVRRIYTVALVIS